MNTQHALVLRARSRVAFQSTPVPPEWQHLHGQTVYKAVVGKDLARFGLTQPFIMADYLGLKYESQLCGDFSFI
jgi:hypothetical protein